MEALVVDFDFLGVQYYQRFAVGAFPVPGLRFVPLFRKDHKRFDITAMGWEVTPTVSTTCSKTAHAYGKVPELFVTENGAAYPDHLVDGRVHDVRRTAYYRDHLAEVARARRDGVPVHGYFCWSYCDNFEWAAGLRPRFGLVHVDYETQRRTVKDSGYWFSRLLGGTLTPDDEVGEALGELFEGGLDAAGSDDDVGDAGGEEGGDRLQGGVGGAADPQRRRVAAGGLVGGAQGGHAGGDVVDGRPHDRDPAVARTRRCGARCARGASPRRGPAAGAARGTAHCGSRRRRRRGGRSTPARRSPTGPGRWRCRR